MRVLRYFDLHGKVAVVTGASRGLGRAFAQALGEAGASLALLSRDADAGLAAVEELQADGIRAEFFAVDVTDREAMATVADAVTDALGPVGVLVNNAGTCIHRPALEVTPEDWRTVLEVNLDGVWNGCQIFGAGMVERRTGSIINIGSMSGFVVNRPQWQPGYNASKAAVHHLTRSLAAEWAPSESASTRWPRATSARRWLRWMTLGTGRGGSKTPRWAGPPSRWSWDRRWCIWPAKPRPS